MRMHATDFVKRLAGAGASQVPPIVVLAGTESLLVRESLQAISHAVFGGESDDEIARYAADDVEWRDVRDELATVSMFASHRLVLLERADEFIKNNRGALETYVAAPAGNSVLVLQPRSFPGNSRLAKAVAKADGVVECTELEGAALHRWLVATARDHHGMELTRDAGTLLIELAGTGLAGLESELAKIASCSAEGRIDIELVRSLVGGWQVQSTFEMLKALRLGQIDRALIEFDRLQESGESMLKLMGGIAYVYRRLAKAVDLARGGARLTDALKSAGVYFKEIDESNRYLRRVGRPEAEAFLPRLLAVDKALKGADDAGRLADHLVVERLLLQLAGSHGKRRQP